MPGQPDPPADDVVIHVDFASGPEEIKLVVRPPDGGRNFFGEPAIFASLPPLPPAIEFQDVEASAGAYKELLRGFVVGQHQPASDNAFEFLKDRFARSGRRPFEWRISGIRPDAGARNPATLPWELVLYDTDGTELIERAAVVRSLKRTDAYKSTTLNEPFRTLVVQGGQLDGVVLRFDREKSHLEQAWRDLGAELQKRIEAPAIAELKCTDLEAKLKSVRPHLLWFSGHGQVTSAGFGFLFSGDKTFTPVNEVARTIRGACQSSALPLVAAFWTCESLRLASDDKAPDASDTPAPNAGEQTHEQLPALVDAMTQIGIEAIIGCQTRVSDVCARIMARALFRNLAEGQGPARALAAARGELARGSDATRPGGEAEWPSPVLWIGGAQMPVLRWARPVGEDGAILLNKLCYESVFRNDEAAAVWQRDPLSLPPAANWITRAPCWVVHKGIHHDIFEVFASLRRAQAENPRALLVITVTGADSGDFLRAFASNMRELQSRIFPGVELTETDWLMSVFALANVERRREDAWRRLLEQKNLVIAIIDKGGLTDLAALQIAMSQRFPIVVFSPTSIISDSSDGGQQTANSWNSDIFVDKGKPSDWPAAQQAFFEALATLNRPLSSTEINDFGRDFEVDQAYQAAGQSLVGYGGRFVLRASLVDTLTRNLDTGRRRAAHLACLCFLQRNGIDPTRSTAVQLGWRLEHALALGRRSEIIDFASSAIAAWRREGSLDSVIRIYQSLKEERRALPLLPLLGVAWAYTLTGKPQLALNLLNQISPTPLSPSNRIDLALQQAESLRNTNERANHEMALSLLEKALTEAKNLQTQFPSDRNIARKVLILRNDVARHRHYFDSQAAAAKREYADIVKQCGDEPDRQYLKIAALRNLGDVSFRYAYGEAEDQDAAITHFREAKQLATRTPDARDQLAEISYVLAQALAQANRKDEFESELGSALKVARRDGNAKIFALADNRRFWTEHSGETTLTTTAWQEWLAIQDQLDSVENHAWAARALVNSRLRAAKRRPASHSDEAIAVLENARELLRRHDGLRGPSDIAERWIPIYAGLAVLQARPQGTSKEAYNPLVWKQLADDLGDTTMQLPADPVQVWNAVP
jgi:hypothetical protein